jgi:anti-sigma factor RsiW
MTCDEAEILLHALIDGELDASHAREVEAHLATCAKCAAAARDYREMKKAVAQGIAQGGLRYTAPPELRRRIEASLPQTAAPTRRALLRGFAMGSAVSAMAATGLFAVILRSDDETRLQTEFVSAHLRSLQANHLTDVVSTDQHTVKPWFNGRIDIAPPVVDLGSQGFALIGGRLDYIDGRPVGSVIYRRRQHVINLFVVQGAGNESRAAKMDAVQGFNIRRWSDRGLDYWAVSDLAKEELASFGEKFEAATRAAG